MNRGRRLVRAGMGTKRSLPCTGATGWNAPTTAMARTASEVTKAAGATDARPPTNSWASPASTHNVVTRTAKGPVRLETLNETV